MGLGATEFRWPQKGKHSLPSSLQTGTQPADTWPLGLCRASELLKVVQSRCSEPLRLWEFMRRPLICMGLFFSFQILSAALLPSGLMGL